jgi:REP-associated tyrosine transposase
MGRALRTADGRYCYHVLNRANARLPFLAEATDYLAFEIVLSEGLERFPGVRLLAYCLLPNHWHLVICPSADGELSTFIARLTRLHVQRWQRRHNAIGSGHLYRRRFRSFPIGPAQHFLAVCRYVESNALRAGLVERAETWTWCSLYRRESRRATAGLLSEWPVAPPADWVEQVNRPQPQLELAAIRRCVNRGRPFGSPPWVSDTVQQLNLQSTLRARGRPRKVWWVL